MRVVAHVPAACLDNLGYIVLAKHQLMKHFFPALIGIVAMTHFAHAQCGPTVICPSNVTVNNTTGQCGANVTYSPATATTTCTSTNVIYSENFQSTVGWTLNTNTGTNGTTPNTWEINATEGGVLPPGCGVANNGDLTLHITCTSLFCGSFITGAVYNASITSNKRTESPVINTTGYTGLTLNFDFISMGDGMNDNASVVYFDGTSWQTLTASIKSVNCVSGQGQWTAYTATLPVACENNPNFRIGFNWTNNNDNVGTDPSVAINNITITTGSSSPIPTITYSQASGSFFPVGTTTVTATATDFASNTDICTFTVTVNDVESPAIAGCPTNMTVPANTAGCSAIVNWSSPVATDNCSATLNSTHVSGSVFPLGTTTVMYTATDPAGNSSTCSFDVTVVNPAIVTITSMMDPIVCEGETDTLVASGASTYVWSTSSTNDSLVVVHSPATTQWIVIGTDANGCTASDTISVTVSSPVVVDVNTSLLDTMCIIDGPVSLNSFATPAGGVWSGPGVTANTFDPSVAGVGAHVVTYTAYNVDSCTSTGTDIIYVDICLGIAAADNLSAVTIYPNPNNGLFTIESVTPTLVEIFNPLGELVLTQNIPAGKNNLSLGQSSVGIYVVKVSSNNSVKYLRMVKEN